jgi:hypothetical protein
MFFPRQSANGCRHRRKAVVHRRQRVYQGMKRCSKCRREKPETEFYRRSDTDGRQYLCKECAKEARKKYRADPVKRAREYAGRRKWRECNRERAHVMDRERSLRNTYGVTVRQYDTMLEEQNGKCALCGKPEKTLLHGKVKRLAVDHDHKTGKVRGLLCNFCNRGLGYFLDDSALLKRASTYVKA